MSINPTPSALIPEQSKKILYVSNLKIVLTVLVVLHHVCVSYGAPGGWYYTQKTTLTGALIPLTLFVSVNQSFFMGFFFFLSAYFISTSYDRKGAAQFLKDRLLRLGIPLVFYSFVLSPILSYLVYYFAYGNHVNYLQYLHGFHPWVDFGVLWFVAALLLFTLIYALWRAVFNKRLSASLHVPSAGAIVLFAAGIGIITFFVRTVFVVGWVLQPLGFQPAHFSQYISLFIVGIAASKNNWLNDIPFKTGKRAALTAILLFLFFPVFYIIKVRSDQP